MKNTIQCPLTFLVMFSASGNDPPLRVLPGEWDTPAGSWIVDRKTRFGFLLFAVRFSLFAFSLNLEQRPHPVKKKVE
jgi:hypothetical protein